MPSPLSFCKRVWIPRGVSARSNRKIKSLASIVQFGTLILSKAFVQESSTEVLPLDRNPNSCHGLNGFACCPDRCERMLALARCLVKLINVARAFGPYLRRRVTPFMDTHHHHDASLEIEKTFQCKMSLQVAMQCQRDPLLSTLCHRDSSSSLRPLSLLTRPCVTPYSIQYSTQSPARQ
jgi:hypothetical protein